VARVGLVAAAARGRRAYVGPVTLLLAVTIAVVLLHEARHSSQPKPSPHHLVRTKSPVAPRRFYTVGAGDTVTGIAAKTGVPLTHIEKLNPRLSPTALFIGEKIRLK
jgi:hypothetical protein